MVIALSYIAAVLTTSSFVPQAIKIIKTKDTADISLIMYMMFVFGTILWIIYGYANQEYALAFANSITFILASVILTYKIKATIQKQK